MSIEQSVERYAEYVKITREIDRKLEIIRNDTAIHSNPDKILNHPEFRARGCANPLHIPRHNPSRVFVGTPIPAEKDRTHESGETGACGILLPHYSRLAGLVFGQQILGEE